MRLFPFRNLEGDESDCIFPYKQGVSTSFMSIINPLKILKVKIEKPLEDYRKAENAINELFALDNFCFDKCISTKVSLYPATQEAFWQFPSIEGCCTKNYSKLRLNIPISQNMRKKFKQLQQ